MTKRIPDEKFTYLDNATNRKVKIAKKKGKDATWYVKKHNSTGEIIPITGNHNPHELEACSGDLYRFMLGKDRAAKSRVVSDADSIHSKVASQENPAGFTVAKPDYTQGLAELLLGRYVLDEGDMNPRNTGLNKNNEASTIDYDLTLYHFKTQLYTKAIRSRFQKDNRTPAQMFVALEKLLKNKLSGEAQIKALNNYYRRALIILLADKPTLDAISKRHSESPTFISGLSEFLTSRIKPFEEEIIKSIGFAECLVKTDFNDLKNEIEGFFKSELKNPNEKLPTQHLLAHIENNFNRIKYLALSTFSALNKSWSKPIINPVQEKLIDYDYKTDADKEIILPDVLDKRGVTKYLINLRQNHPEEYSSRLHALAANLVKIEKQQTEFVLQSDKNALAAVNELVTSLISYFNDENAHRAGRAINNDENLSKAAFCGVTFFNAGYSPEQRAAADTMRENELLGISSSSSKYKPEDLEAAAHQGRLKDANKDNAPSMTKKSV